MNCPFCGSTLAKVAAICPNCKIQLPEQNLFAYYEAVLARDKSLAKVENRTKLDAQVKIEAEARAKLLEEARERARIEDERLAMERLRESEELRAKHQAMAEEMRIKREKFLEKNSMKLKVGGFVLVLLIAGGLVAQYLIGSKENTKIAQVASEDKKLAACVALGYAAKDTVELLNRTLEFNRDGGLTESKIKNLRMYSIDIQASLLSQTSGEAFSTPQLEATIIKVAGSLNAYPDKLKGLKTEAEILEKATEPLYQVIKKSQKVCVASGLANQFNNASGWDK